MIYQTTSNRNKWDALQNYYLIERDGMHLVREHKLRIPFGIEKEFPRFVPDGSGKSGC